MLHKSAVCGTITLTVCEVIIISHTLDRLNIDGVQIYRITDKKFTTGSVRIKLFAPYEKETAPALALLPAVLCACNAEYPTQEALTKRLNELYGGNIWGSCAQLSNMLELSFSCDFILDKFAIDCEKIALPTVKLLLDCIFKPFVCGDAFDAEEFDIRKQDLLDAIDSEINERSSYAMTVAYETVYRGEISAYRHYYSRESVEALTPERAYEVYKSLIDTARVVVTICSGEEHPEVEGLIASAFRGHSNTDAPFEYYTPSPIKPQHESAVYPLDVKQASIVLAFKSDSTDYFASRLMSMMFGGSPTSMLSLTVREKMSLCYYCQSAFSETKNTMLVVSGVDYKNISATQKAVCDILQSIAEGKFTDAELIETKLFYTSRLRSGLDRKSALMDWYLREVFTGERMTVDEAIAMINSISRERVIAAARSFKLDTLFTLGKEANND